MDIWDKGFQEPKVRFPEEIIKDYIKSFDKATEGYASLSLRTIEGVDKTVLGLNADFQYELRLTSNIIGGYSFQVFRFGYNVTIYPVRIIFADEIADELGIHEASFGDRVITVDDEATFSHLVKSAFTSERFREIVGGLIKITKARIKAAME